ncbi:MAG: DUF445 family protein [Burkholderiales bacterium]|nr:DUF445 family protein [Burkholderiales bacterium]
MDPAKAQELSRSKRQALLLLLLAAAVFVGTALAPRGPWLDGVKAVAEAAMVGALADWFAVVALFRRVPLPVVARHTAIIPRNKDRIADNLAQFVRDKFLDAPSIVGLIRKHDPAQRIAQWLTAPANTELLGGYVATLTAGLLELTDDARIQRFIRDALHALLGKLDLSQSMGTLLDTLTQDGRHQKLLDAGIAQFVALLDKPETRAFIAARIVEWLKREHPKKERVLPTEWLGENGAAMVAKAVNSVLSDISANPRHVLRERFDAAAATLIDRLKTDPAFLAKGEQIKRYIQDDPALNRYIAELWGQLRRWLKDDITRGDSVLHARVAAAGQWLGKELATNAALREALNEHMETAARAMAPDFSAFLTRHISDTVKNWDAADMSRQIELHIGKDLQFIRINGTLVGGCIGLLLYLSSYAIEAVRAHLM